MLNLESLPKWFLAALLSFFMIFLPTYIDLEKRVAVMETRQEEYESRDKRTVEILDRLSDGVSNLAIATTQLKTEMKNLKEK